MAHEIAHAETFAASSANGNLVFGVRKDTATGLASVDGLLQPLITDADGKLYVNSGGTGTDVTVTSIAAGDNNIGNVDIVTVPVPLSTTGGGTEATALRVTVASDSTGVLSVDDNAGSLTIDGTVSVNLNAGTNTNEVVGDVAQDAAAAGNPVLVAGSAETMADSAPANRVSADADACRLSVTDGALYTIPSGPQTWGYHENSSNALTDTEVHASPGVGLSLYVSTIVVSTGAATAFNIFFEEGASTVLGPYYLEAVAGRGLVIPFMTPKKITAATALTVTTSAAIAHSIDITGFVAPG